MFIPSSLRSKELLVRLGLSILVFSLAKSPKSQRSLSAIYLVFSVLFASQTFNRIFAPLAPKFQETFISRLASLLLNTKAIRNEYITPINEEIDGTRAKTLKAWDKWGKLRLKIPEDGLSETEIVGIVDHLSAEIESAVVHEDYSGAIYLYAFKDSENVTANGNSANGISNGHSSGKIDFTELNMSLERLYTHSFRKSFLWNSLHEGEFGVGYWLSYQVIRMVGDIFGAKPENVMGQITTGGTDSLCNAIRIYREWGTVNRNLDAGEGTIIACENVHAAVDKGCTMYNVNLVKIPMDSAGRMSMKHLDRAIFMAGTSLIGIIASAPSFSLGVRDKIKAVAKRAKRAGVGCHVDCCLGGFIINFLGEDAESNFLDEELFPGVTSISCDTHKNGWAPKGSSVLLTTNIHDKVLRKVNLSYYSAYSIPDWDGGVYGTPSNPGSQHCSHVLQAYVGLLRIGKSGYSTIANAINKTVLDCVAILESDNRIEVLGEHANGKKGVNVFGFKVSSALGWGVGASYALAHELQQRNVVVSALAGDRLHYAVTGRSALDSDFLDRFEKAFKGAIDATEKSAQLVLRGEGAFSGDAGMYGTLDAAMKPTAENTKTFAEYAGNKIMGKKVATELVRGHFYALQDPFSTVEFKA